MAGSLSAPETQPEQACAETGISRALPKRPFGGSSIQPHAVGHPAMYIGEHSPTEAGKGLGGTANTVKIRLFEPRRNNFQQQMLVPSDQWNSQKSLGTQAENLTLQKRRC